MARRESFQTSFNGGIVDPRLADNDQLELYFSGAADILNLRPSPQGGLMLRGGLAWCGRHRGAVSAIDLTAATITFAADGDSGGTVSLPPVPPDDPFPYPDRPFAPGFNGDFQP
jgi:hypothetical protein